MRSHDSRLISQIAASFHHSARWVSLRDRQRANLDMQ